ncbi:MAG: transcriptional regulator, AraC family [Herbinix sp.]|jgi:AraC family transcriptional regulator|nr:transcriptional regulator, AraC family [Herbinix sp.]
MDTIVRVQRAIDFVEDNILDELKYDVIASQAYMSSCHFQRIFSILSNITIGEYIRNRRLTLAGIDLKASEAKVIDIAFKYGYETSESFSRAFTRFHEVTPTIARNQESQLKSFAKISIKNTLEGKKDAMQELSKRGYTVKENGAVYHTRNMDKTAKWFEDVLGWYAGIDARNEAGAGTYGCVLPVPGELVNMQIAPFKGIHMFYGESQNNVVAFMLIEGIDKLYDFVKKNGWEKITEIKIQPWGAKTCDVTTIDGSIITFFELMELKV